MLRFFILPLLTAKNSPKAWKRLIHFRLEVPSRPPSEWRGVSVAGSFIFRVIFIFLSFSLVVWFILQQDTQAVELPFFKKFLFFIHFSVIFFGGLEINAYLCRQKNDGGITRPMGLDPG